MKTDLDEFLAKTLRGESPAWAQMEQDECAPDVAVARVHLHGIALMLSALPEAMGDWPPAVQQAVLEEARTQQMWEVSHHQMVAALIERLASAGIAAVVMKGTALAYSVYDVPAMRRRGDTDLLVPESQLGQVREILVQQGLRQRDVPYGLLFQEGWIHETAFGTMHGIDLHWRTSDSPVLEQVLPSADYFALSQPLPRLSPHACMADPVLTFVQVALNRAWHGFHGYMVDAERISNGDRLVWASDFDRLARGMSPEDWGRLEAIASTRQVAPIVHDALRYAHEAFATPLPGGLLDRLDQAPATSPVIAYLAQADMMRRHRADIAALPGWHAKLRFIAPLVFPSGRYLRHRYPASAHWPTLALYARWLLHNARRLVTGRRR